MATQPAIFPTELFDVPRRLAGAYDVFRSEAAALAPDEWLPWGERVSYNDGWLVYPLVLAIMPPKFCVDFRRHRARCPGSWALLSDPRVVQAAFSRLLPGCHIYPHSDNPAFDLLRFHLGLSNAGHAGLRLMDQTVIRQLPGEHYVIDTSIVHEAGNLGDTPRDVLLVDFRATERELAIVDRLRAEATGDAPAAPDRASM